MPLKVVIETNRTQVALTAEDFYLRDQGALDGACQRARNHWVYGEEDIVRLATVIACGIARCHAFEQGNKRTAVIAGLMFIRLNGYVWTMDNDILLGVLVEAVVTGRMDEETFAESIRPFVKLAP